MADSRRQALNELGHQRNNNSYSKNTNWVLYITDPDKSAESLAKSVHDRQMTGAATGSLKKTAPIHTFKFGLSRRFVQHSSLPTIPGALHAHELYVISQTNALHAKVPTCFYENILIPQVKIIRLGPSSLISQNETIKAIASYSFLSVYLTGIKNIYDTTILTMRYSNLTYMKATVEASDGVLNGADVMGYYNLSDYSKLNAVAGAAAAELPA